MLKELGMSGQEIGALLAIFSSIISNLGVNIQKFSHVENSQLPSMSQKSYLLRPVWWIGLLLVILGSAGDFAAFALATQALVAALGGGTTMISNVVIAHYFNKEKLYRTDLIGVFFVVIGVILIAVITDPNKQYTLEELEKRFLKKGFLIYISIVLISMISLLATIKGSLAHKLRNQLRFSRRRQKRLMKNFELRFQTLEDRVVELERKVRKQKDGNSNDSENRRRKEAKLQTVDDIMEGLASRDHVPYYYAVCSGVVGAVSVLLAKCAAMMVAKTMQGDNQLTHPVTYAFVGGMVITILIQTHLLNVATSLGDTMTVFPMFQATWISFSVIGGIVFYDTEKDFTTEKWILYPAALILIGLGILFLLQHEKRKRAALRAEGLLHTRTMLSSDDDEDLFLDMKSPLLS